MDAQQYSYSLKDLGAIIVKDKHIRDGLWDVFLRSDFMAANIDFGQGKGGRPTFVVTVTEVGIIRTTAKGPNTIDAAEVSSPIIYPLTPILKPKDH